MRKRIYIVLIIFLVFLLKVQDVHSQENCNASLIVHYHHHKEAYNHELHVFNHLDTNEIIEPIYNDEFGLVFDISICSISKDKIGISIIEKNKHQTIEVIKVDVSDIKGTNKTKDVYLLEGANTVYDASYLAEPNNGHVVIIYYDHDDIDKWQDFHVWSEGSDNLNKNIDFDYLYAHNLFRIGVINVPNDSEELIGLRIRKNKDWDIVDDEWKNQIEYIENDDLGHFYKKSGERFINVSDIIGGGYKFIYLIKGDKTIYENFETFLEKIPQMKFNEVSFQSKKTLFVEFNQDITYNPQSGPDINRFIIKDNEGNKLNIEKIIYDDTKTVDNKFMLILEDEIENEAYNIEYQYNLLGEEKTIAKEVFISDGVFDDLPVEEVNRNLIYYILGGFIILLLIGGGALILYRKKQ